MPTPEARLLRALRALAAVPFRDALLHAIVAFEARHAAGAYVRADLDERLEKIGMVMINRLKRELDGIGPKRHHDDELREAGGGGRGRAHARAIGSRRR